MSVERTPAFVVVGAASRDVTDADARGWRLGGGVSYSALTIARLGLTVGALVGVDGAAAEAPELVRLEAAGVSVRRVPLEHGPVFENVEGANGRIQHVRSTSDPVPPGALPPEWRAAGGWVLAPVAGELPDAWAAVPGDAAFVALGWQGLLRELVAGAPVRRRTPAPSTLLRRADLVGVSREDLDPSEPLEALAACLRPGATLAVTSGDRGGLVLRVEAGGFAARRRYPGIPAARIVDPTGAGDVFLATLAAARLDPRLVGGRIDRHMDLLLAAAAASLVVEAPGLEGVPDRPSIRARIREAGVPRPASG